MAKDKLNNRICSYVQHRVRMTLRQRKALNDLWAQYGLEVVVEGQSPFDLVDVFGRKAPCVLEIGFGMGHSLFEMAKANPDYDFIGIDVYLPGIGALLADANEADVTNLRVFYADAWEILQYSIAPACLYRIQIFFPDPWPKRKHYKRRLINPDFVNLAAEKLEQGGYLHLATDWEDYANAILKVLDAASQFENKAGAGHFSAKPDYRPCTKYERRGEQLGHAVRDIIFIKNASAHR